MQWVLGIHTHTQARVSSFAPRNQKLKENKLRTTIKPI